MQEQNAAHEHGGLWRLRRGGVIALAIGSALALGCERMVLESAPLDCEDGHCDETWASDGGVAEDEEEAHELEIEPPADDIDDAIVDDNVIDDLVVTMDEAGFGGGSETPTCDTVDARLLNDFGIRVVTPATGLDGLAPGTLGCRGRVKVYQMYALAFAYSGYRRRLRPAETLTIRLYRSDNPRSGWCSGYVPNANVIRITDLPQCLSIVSGLDDPDFRQMAMFLIHESGHVIANRNPGLKALFRDANLPQRDPQCYDRGFLKTYYYRSGVSPVSESFAESVALFVGNRKRGHLATIRNFRDECPNTYSWVRRNVFEY